MVVSTLVYNASTGSDTAASGAGPATAITGSNATNGLGNVVNLDGSPDLSGVAVNDVLYGNISGNVRQLSRITAVDDGADTVTTEDTMSFSGGGEPWAIGGKRLTLDANTSRPDLADGKAGWQFELEAGTYSVAQTNTIGVGTSSNTEGSSSLVAASGASPTLSWTGDFAAITLAANTEWFVRGITFSNTTSTNDAARSISVTGNDCRVAAHDCTFDQHGCAFYTDNRGYWQFIGCTITANITSDGALRLGVGSNALIMNCIIHDAGEWGVSVTGGTRVGFTMVGCIVRDCADDGIHIDSSIRGVYTIKNCVIHKNAGEGINLIGTHQTDAHDVFCIVNNIVTDNTAYGIASVNAWHEQAFIDYNAFRGNTSGEMNNITSGANDVTLTADPYTNEATDDYTLNDTAGGGVACRDVGYGYNG